MGDSVGGRVSREIRELSERREGGGGEEGGTDSPSLWRDCSMLMLRMGWLGRLAGFEKKNFGGCHS